MAKKTKRSATEDESSPGSSAASSSEDTEETARRKRRRSQARRNNSKKKRSYSQGKEIIKFLSEVKEEVCKQSKQATESKEEICKQLERVTQDNQEMRKQLSEILTDLRKQRDLHTNGSSGDDSDAPRSQSNQVQPPRYRLVFKSGVTDKIEKGQLLEITVALVDGNNQTVENGPLANATVELVVVNAEFNQHNNQHKWSREDFEINIIKARQGNLATVDVDQSVKSIVSDGRFNLVQGVKCHSGFKIFRNSGNKKVRLGVMVVSPTEERVLEGLSNPFIARGHDRDRSNSRHINLSHNRSNTQRQALVDNGYQEQNSSSFFNSSWPNPTHQAGGRTRQALVDNIYQVQNGQMPNLQNPLSPNSTQTGEIRQALVDNRYQVQNGQMPNLQNPLLPNSTQTGKIRLNTTTRLQHPFLGNPTMPSSGLNINGEPQLPFLGNPPMLSAEPSASQEHQDLLQYQHFRHLSMMAQAATDNQISMQFDMDQRVLPVQLLWDRPNVEPSKPRWNIFDTLIPPKEHFGSLSLACIQKPVLCKRQRSVLIEPLEPDDSDEERQLKSRRLSKYQLRFVNKVCEAYYTRDQVKADDGNLLMVALFDENNTKITAGPLSSASVEVVALHGDFNVNGQDYWTSEEFSRSVVCPPPGEEASSVLGGDRTLVLAGGEACLGDAFFQRTSFCARTAKFKMGVRLLDSTQEERIQEGISEPFWVKERRVEELRGTDGATTHKAPPPGFRFRPTEEELMANYLCHRDAAKPFPVQVIAEVDIYKFDPWDLPAKAVYGESEWYFYSRPATRGTSERYRASGSGYWNWKATDQKETAIRIPFPAGDDKMVGFKKTLVFYTGHAPNGNETSWIMDEYRLSTSRSRLDERVLYKIYNKLRRPVQSTYEQVQRLGQQLPEPEFLPYNDLPPGFGFHPSDEELISHYLRNRTTVAPCMAPTFIAEVDIYKCEPWDLPGKPIFGESEWYFFYRRDRKYATGARPNRPTQSGYWKATGKDRMITTLSAAADHDKIILGKKKTLVFYKGRAPRGERTKWIMQEYRLHDDDNPLGAKESASSTSSTSDEWLLCKIYKMVKPNQRTTSSSISDCITHLPYTPSTPEPSPSPSRCGSESDDTKQMPVLSDILM